MKLASLFAVLESVSGLMSYWQAEEEKEQERQWRQTFINLSPIELEIIYDREKFWGKRGWGWWFVR